MSFGAPVMLLLLPLVPLMAWLMYRAREHRRMAQVRFADQGLLSAIAGTERTGYAVAHIALVSCACLLLVLALARPRGGVTEEEVTGEGIDIVFAMDISQSMLADDLEYSRLDIMKAIATELVEENPNDRIGVIGFAGEAFVVCPLTLDHATVNTFIEIQGTMPGIRQGTAIGSAIETAIQRFDSTNSRVLILFTDGESNKGIDPIAAAQLAAQAGIRIYTVGIGSPTGTQLYEDRSDIYGVRRPRVHNGAPVIVKLDEATLQKISEITGGSYIGIQKLEDIERAFLHLDKSAKQVFAMGLRTAKIEFGPWFMLAAALLLWIDFLVELYRVNPLGFDWVRGRSGAGMLRKRPSEG